MKVSMIQYIAAVVLAVALAGCRPAPHDPSSIDQSDPLVVFAAASLTEAFAEVGEQFEREHGIRVRFHFDGSSTLQLQLDQGARADVFASADETHMEKVAAGVGIDGESAIFARNRLALIVSAKQSRTITHLRDLSRPGLKLVLAHPSVPAGKYARDILQAAAMHPDFDEAFPERVLANVRSEEANVKQVALKVQLGEADAGIVYQTDITPTVASATEVVSIPDELNQLAAYPIAVVRNSDKRERAHTFLKFVLSDSGQDIMAKYGFLPGGELEQVLPEHDRPAIPPGRENALDHGRVRGVSR